MRPFFSVVIPTLNEEEHLPILLDCLSKQIDHDYEVILVDGNSDDMTLDRANEFESKLPRFTALNSKVRHQSVQRNMGANNSKGNYLIFLDADVTIPSNFLSEIHNFLLINEDTELLTTRIKPDSEEVSDKLITSICNFWFDVAALTDRPVLNGFNVITRRETFLKVGGFSEEIKMNEDHDLARKFARMGHKLKVLHYPYLTCSFRRFRREGTLSVLRKYAVSLAFNSIDRRISDDDAAKIFDYEMGGGIKKKTKGSRDFPDLNNFLKMFLGSDEKK